jgi:hypothetical protein
LAELISAGIPEGATDSELKKLKCPVDRHTTFALKKSEFEKARDAHLKAHPETAIPALRMPARTKRRMLDLPKGDDLKKLFWTVPIHRLAKTKHVACATMALVAKDNGIILPEKGDWQKRAAGIPVVIPDEIAKLFPDGLPPYIAKVGRRPRVKYPELAECFKLTWQHSQTDLGGILKCSTASVERKIKELKLLVPGHSYWHAKPEHRTIADLPAPELLEEVRQAYADGLIDSTVAHLEGIERDLVAPKPWHREQHRIITDAIKEMEWWSSFHLDESWPKKLPEAEVPLPLSAQPPPAKYVTPQPFIREPKIGRNDPCPCGSGKKYKKCCGKG